MTIVLATSAFVAVGTAREQQQTVAGTVVSHARACDSDNGIEKQAEKARGGGPSEDSARTTKHHPMPKRMRGKGSARSVTPTIATRNLVSHIVVGPQVTKPP
jgi:hypothetical protein